MTNHNNQMSIIEELTAVHQQVTRHIVNGEFHELAHYLNNFANRRTDIQVLKILLVAAKNAKDNPWVGLAYNSVKKVYDEKEADLKAIAEGREPIKRTTDLEHMKAIFARNGAKNISESIRDGEILLHVGNEGCFIFDLDGNEIGMDF